MKKKLLSLLFTAQVVFANRIEPLRLVQPIQKLYLETSLVNQSAPDFVQRKLEIKELANKNENTIANYKISNFREDTEVCLLARLLVGESDICAKTERIGIAYTVVNRINWGMDLKEIMLFPKAYSCFNPDSKRLEELKDPLKYNAREFSKCLEIAEGVITKRYKDPQKGNALL